MSITNRPELHMHLRHDYIFVMNKELEEVQVQAVAKDLTEQKFNCAIKKDESDQWLLLVGMNDQEKVLTEAEAQLCLAPRVHANNIKQLKVEAKRAAVKKYLDPRVMDAEERKLFEMENKDEFCGGDYDEILNEAEKSRLIYIIFHKIQLKSMTHTLDALPANKYRRMDDKETMLNFLMRLDLMEELVPLWSKSRQIRAVREGLENAQDSRLKAMSKKLSNVFVNVEDIRMYHGDEVAIYFEWMNYFQKWLIFPAIFAVIVWIGNTYFFTIETSPLAGLFSVFMSVWGTLYITNWRRHTHSLDVEWDDYVVQQDIENLRKEFYGKTRINQVTDEPEMYFTFKERIPLYLKSLAIVLPCMAAACAVIIAFLNVTGVIRPEKSAMFDIPVLSKLADPGAIFDPEGYTNMVPAIAQAIVTVIMNFAFRSVAKYTAEIENHKTQKAFNNSVFIKRFIFEFTDFMMYLFYIGLYQLDIKMLRVNLISLFMVDEVRRVFCELILPMFLQNTDKIGEGLKSALTRSASKTDEQFEKDVEAKILAEEVAELERDEMELFDDYLEMIMTFGYITLFAAAFPMGATVTSLFIYIETKSDTYKMETVCRRPFSRKAHDVGVWELTLDLFTFSAVFTNIILACFASDQIDAILPFMANYREESMVSVITVFFIEHFLVLFVVIVRFMYEGRPKWVSIFHDRRHHKSFKKAEKKGVTTKTLKLN